MKKLMLVIILVSTLLFGSLTTAAFADSSEDYKVIKRASKDKKNTGDIKWFRIEVTEKGKEKAKVKIKLPVSLIEMLADSTDGKINLEKKVNVDLKKVLADLKKNGPMTLVEIESEEGNVKIWFE